MKIRNYLPSETTSPASITVELPQYPFAVAYSATSVIMPFKACRLKKIEMWSNFNPDYSIDHNTINLSFSHSQGVRQIELSDTATFEHVAHISRSFKEDEKVGWWYTSESGSTNPELTLLVNHRTIIEWTFEYILADGTDGSGKLQTGLSGLTLGLVYTNIIGGLLPVGRKAAVAFYY